MRAVPVLLDDRPLTLVGQFRRALRLRRYNWRTEEAYVGWVRRFVRFHAMQHPRALTPTHVRLFLSHLSIDRSVSASTQNQAFGVGLPAASSSVKIDSAIIRTTSTDTSSHHRLLVPLQDGPHRLTVRRIGYLEHSIDFHVRGDSLVSALLRCAKRPLE